MVGDLCFQGEPNENGEIEIGYGTYDHFQNMGYMTEAVGALVRWGLGQERVLAVVAETNADNIPSQKILKNNGFHCLGQAGEILSGERKRVSSRYTKNLNLTISLMPAQPYFARHSPSLCLANTIIYNTMNKLLPWRPFSPFSAFPSCLSAQEAPAPPRLIIGIVVDQMRYDFLYRYSSKYGPGGFKRLLREGFSCENTHYNFAPTFTGPGHAAIYTGATPSVNGIIANDWYDRQWGKHRYVTADTTENTVGGEGRVGQHSPRVLLSTTITDELRLSNAFKSKVVGVCLKDRGRSCPPAMYPMPATG